MLLTNVIIDQKEYEFDDKDIVLIGKTIKDLRNESNLSQTDLSKQIGIDCTTLYYLEKGEKQGTIKNLKKVLNYFGYQLSIKIKK